ncbi:MAG: extracellular solute-binding protein [Clostridia bacterium]|nr:extracellular solute-binding protein [Clostridia bacterium]
MKKKIVAIAMALTSIFSSIGLAACGSGDDDGGAGGDGGAGANVNTASNAIVGIYNAGYGVDAITKIARAFNEEEDHKNKGWTVSVSDQGGGFISSNVTSKLQAAAGDFDLIMTGNVSVYNIVDKGSKYLDGYDCALEKITDVYEAYVPGESVQVKNKMVKQFYDYNTFKGDQYAMTWATGPSGVAYRADFFDTIFGKGQWTAPRTTNELIEMANTILEEGYTPYIWSTSGSYWYYSVLAWWRQMIDDQEFNDFWNCIDENGDLSPEVFKSEARLLAFQELEKILSGPDGSYRFDGHLHAKSGTLSNNETQIMLYNTSNKICMMANSDWLENEMKQSEIMPGDVDIGIFRTPVISGILKVTDKTTGQKVDRFETIKTEALLREVISSIDAGKENHDGVSADDYAALKKIRSYTGTEAQNHTTFIPAYSNAKEVAKEFMKYLATDKAMQIYYNEVGTFLPFDTTNIQVDTSTRFRRDIYNMSLNANYVSTFDSQNPIFYKTGLNYFMSSKIEQKIATTSANDHMTGFEYWTWVYDEAVKEWDTALAQSRS